MYSQKCLSFVYASGMVLAAQSSCWALSQNPQQNHVAESQGDSAVKIKATGSGNELMLATASAMNSIKSSSESASQIKQMLVSMSGNVEFVASLAQTVGELNSVLEGMKKDLSQNINTSVEPLNDLAKIVEKFIQLSDHQGSMTIFIDAEISSLNASIDLFKQKSTEVSSITAQSYNDLIALARTYLDELKNKKIRLSSASMAFNNLKIRLEEERELRLAILGVRMAQKTLHGLDNVLSCLTKALGLIAEAIPSSAESNKVDR